MTDELSDPHHWPAVVDDATAWNDADLSNIATAADGSQEYMCEEVVALVAEVRRLRHAIDNSATPVKW